MNAPIVITNVTPAHVAALLKEIDADSKSRVVTITASPNSYEIVGHGVDAKVDYSPAAQQLTVTVVSKPWIETMSDIRDKIVAALGA